MYFVMKLYMFRTVRLSILKSSFTVRSAVIYVIQTLYTQLSSRSICSCSKVVYKPVWHILLLSVQRMNSWLWTEELSETCRVSCQNNFVKLMHLVGFIIKSIATTRCTVAQKSAVLKGSSNPQSGIITDIDWGSSRSGEVCLCVFKHICSYHHLQATGRSGEREFFGRISDPTAMRLSPDFYRLSIWTCFKVKWTAFEYLKSVVLCEFCNRTYLLLSVSVFIVWLKLSSIAVEKWLTVSCCSHWCSSAFILCSCHKTSSFILVLPWSEGMKVARRQV
jgi:hypothetical protein